ncbi:MAG: DUF523 domain-containing protein [Nitrospiraceae bacterium]|nr:DUF523 domain-containing protein [Nitrospiraceae bacterium]
MYLVSACLAGFNTRYDGGNCLDERVRRLVLAGRAVPVCPEQLGGLPTPRPAVEFASGDGADALDGKTKVHMVDNRPHPPLRSSLSHWERVWVRETAGEKADYTGTLVRGARETLRIARLYGIKEAVFKDGSPSCGTSYVCSGGQKRAGRGITAELLSREGLMVRGVDSLQG